MKTIFVYSTTQRTIIGRVLGQLIQWTKSAEVKCAQTTHKKELIENQQPPNLIIYVLHLLCISANSRTFDFLQFNNCIYV